MVEVVYGGGNATFDGSPIEEGKEGGREGGERIALSSRGGQKPPRQADGIYAEVGAAKRAGRRNAEEKDTEKERREPGETKVGQRPGHVEKNGAHNVQDGDTLSYSSKQRPFSAAAPGSAACPFRKRCAITRLENDETRRIPPATPALLLAAIYFSLS